jgi:tetratricopeptide (TPR) repeat protein
MYDINILEEEWKQYRRKRFRPWIFAGIGLIFITVLAVVFFEPGQFDRLSFHKKEKRSLDKKKTEENILIDGPLVNLEVKNADSITDTPLVEVSVENETDDQDKVDKDISKKTLQIKVVEANDRNAFKEVAKRFRLGHDVDDSLFLAKSYYAIGDYKKAEYWALQTNKVDENIEESWLIFIKAKMKRGQKNEALRILNTYIKRTNSAEAKVLRERIKKGRL